VTLIHADWQVNPPTAADAPDAESRYVVAASMLDHRLSTAPATKNSRRQGFRGWGG
jgi:hypothetical protein